MSLSALFTVIFLSGVIIYLVLVASKAFIAYQSDLLCYSIQQEINAKIAVIPPEACIIEQIDANNPEFKALLDSLNKESVLDGLFPYAKDIDRIYMVIKLKDKVIYSNEKEDEDIRRIADFYKDTEAVRPILDADRNETGSVAVGVNPQFILMLLIPVLLAVIFLGILALLVSRVLSMFLVIPIINPVRQLETKVKAIAEGDQETAANTQLILKKPLKEIESLVDSTNKIMNRLTGYNDILENQNTELEVQNEELMESKLQIQKHQAQLIQSEKMASVGMLTAAITHEINTPIGAINSNAQLEEMVLSVILNHETVQKNDELIIMFSQLKEANEVNLMACGRIIEIIKSLKSFSRLDQADFQEVDLNEGIKSVLVLTNNLLKRRITVHEEFGDIPLVKCFPGQLNQVFMNIVVNASQAIEGEGELFIKTFQQDRQLYISFKDTGTGIKQEDISKLFDPGFTTKGVGVGLGLGLYISYNIVHNHNGEISVVSELGKGAEFIIKIPLDNDRT